MSTNPTRVLIVDDTITYRTIVRNVLSNMPGIEVVGVAANGKIAMDKIESLKPDVLTLDLEMPVMDGLAVLEQLKQTGSHVGAIVLSSTSMYGANATMKALRLGAFDFVAKPSGKTAEENIQSLRQELCPKIEAFVRTHQVQAILSGHHTTPTANGSALRQESGSKNSPASSSEGAKGVADTATSSPPIANTGQIEVVAIGISTGGPQSLNQVLPQLPANLPVPVLIVQHMPPLFTKSLADDLNKRCALHVAEATDGEVVEPGHILIAPGGKQMKVVLQNGQAILRITDDPPENNCRPSVDYLFRSVAEAYGPNALGIVMTGMGNDGTAGGKVLKQAGAQILAQDEATSVVFGMPRMIIQENIVDAIIPLDRIAMEIARITRKRGVLCK